MVSNMKITLSKYISYSHKLLLFIIFMYFILFTISKGISLEPTITLNSPTSFPVDI